MKNTLPPELAGIRPAYSHLIDYGTVEQMADLMKATDACMSNPHDRDHGDEVLVDIKCPRYLQWVKEWEMSLRTALLT